MKKIFSLIKATMSSDMNIFKISQKKNNKKTNIIFPLFLSLVLMVGIYTSLDPFFEKLETLNLQSVGLSIFVFMISFVTLIEGIYKSGPLLFNTHDDQLLLSLPIERRTVLLIRIFKFYLFEVVFNSIFFIPIVISYIVHTSNVSLSFYLTTIIMLFMIPIIPIVISCFIGAITMSVSSRFKFKGFVQIVISFIFMILIGFLSYKLDDIINDLARYANSINDIITKIYYPAGVYMSLAMEFDLLKLVIFILINLLLLIVSVYILSLFYFKINSRIKSVTTVSNTSLDKIIIKSKSVYYSLIKKELITFFNTPVFIINAGFGLVMYIVLSIAISIKYDAVITELKSFISIDFISNNTSLLIFILILFTGFMTSITNSVISLEGRNINILKSLPVNTKTILMSKIYAALVITTPLMLVGDLLLFIRFKISITECLLLIVLTIIIPLINHFIGLIVNLKYPKLDCESSAEVVKQSASSFISVMIGMGLLLVSSFVLYKIFGKFDSLLILLLYTGVYLIIDVVLYLYLIKRSVKDFESLSV